MEKIILVTIGIAAFAALIAEVSGIMEHVRTFLTWVVYGPYNKRVIAIISHRSCFIPGKFWSKFRPKYITRLKPLDCPKCLAFWLSIIYCLLTRATLPDFIFTVGCAPILSILIIKLIQR